MGVDESAKTPLPPANRPCRRTGFCRIISTLLGRSPSAAIPGCSMLWLGLLSVVQIAFLPGYIALWALKLNERPGQTLVLSFALSLTLNHLLLWPWC